MLRHLKIKRKLYSMRWFYHRRRSGGRQLHYLFTRPRGPFPKKWRTRTTPQRTTPEKNAALFSFFVPGDLGLWPLTPKFELGRDLCTVHLIAKFHHPTFNRSEVIVLTNKQTNWQTNRRLWKHPPRSAMLRRWANICYIMYEMTTVLVTTKMAFSPKTDVLCLVFVFPDIVNSDIYILLFTAWCL